MKRSDINEILGHTRQFFSMHDVHLPPFASFPPTKWQQLDQAAWQEVFEKTSTAAAPWYLVPADNRWYSRAVVSELLRTTLKNMNMTWPPLEPEVDPDEVRRRLA